MNKCDAEWENCKSSHTKTIGGGLVCMLIGSAKATERLDWWVGGVSERYLVLDGGDGERRVGVWGSWCCKFVITLFMTFNG